VLDYVPVRVAPELVAAGAGLPLAATVLLPGMAGVVVAVAVDLDGQTLLGPTAVHSPSAGRPVGLRERESRCAQVSEEASLELAQRDANVAVQDPAQFPSTGAGRPPGQNRLDLARRGAMTYAGLMACTCEVVYPEHRGEIDKCAGCCSHRNPAPNGGVLRVDSPAAVRGEALYPSFGRRDHLGWWRRAFEEADEVACRAPTQERPRPTSPHRREIPGLEARGAVSDTVDPPMLAKQRTPANPMPDLLRSDPRPQQLRASNNTVRD
jgi:hypothetical protein